MLNKYHQKKKSFEKKARERCQNICEGEKKKAEKRSKTDLKEEIFEEEKGKSINIIMIEIRSFLKKKNKKSLDI